MPDGLFNQQSEGYTMKQSHFFTRFSKFRTFFAVLVLSGSAFPFALGAQTGVSIACEDCSLSLQSECAIHTGQELGLSTGGQVWVFDVPNAQINRFVLEEIPPGTVIQGEQEELLVGGTMLAIHEPFEAEAQEAFTEFMLIIRDILRPAGGGQALVQCFQSDLSSIMSEPITIEASGAEIQFEIDEETLGIPLEPPVIFNWDVPPDVLDSAFSDSFVGFRQIGPAFRSAVPLGDFMAQVYLVVMNFASLITSIPIDARVSIVIVFSDGSTGVLVLKPNLAEPENTEWEVDPDSLRDSDGNPIPSRFQDVPDLLEFSGESPGENNLERMLERLALLGVPFIRPDRVQDCRVVRCRMVDGVLKCDFVC